MRVHDERHLIRPDPAPAELVEEPRRLVDAEVLLRPLGELRPAPVSTTTTLPVPSRMSRQFMSSATRLSASAGCVFSHSGFGTMPYIEATVEPKDAVTEDLDLEATDAHEEAV